MNIFDLENISDLPEDVRTWISVKQTIRKKLLSLFDEKVNLSTSEIIVGLFRKYEYKMERKNITGHLYSLCKRGIIKKISRGVYSKVKQR